MAKIPKQKKKMFDSGTAKISMMIKILVQDKKGIEFGYRRHHR